MNKKTIFSIAIAASAALISSCGNQANSAATTTGTVATQEVQETSNGYLVGKPMVDPTTGQPVKDHYISPFKPYNPIVAKGFKSGQLAGDPSTITVDPKTGKADKSTMKIFKLP